MEFNSFNQMYHIQGNYTKLEDSKSQVTPTVQENQGTNDPDQFKQGVNSFYNVVKNHSVIPEKSDVSQEDARSVVIGQSLPDKNYKKLPSEIFFG